MHVLQLLHRPARSPYAADFMNAGSSASRSAPAENTLVGRPDHQALVVLLGQLDRLRRPSITSGLIGVHLANECWRSALRRRASRARTSPSFLKASCRPFRHRARSRRARFRGTAGARTPASVRGATKRCCAGAPRAFGRVHAAGVGHRAFEHPRRQRRGRQRLAGVDVFLDPVRDLLPAGLLPELERTLLQAEAPAHREVDVARAFGDGRPGARPRSGSCRAGSPTGTAPADPSIRAAASGARPAGFFSMRPTDLVGLAAAGDVLARLSGRSAGCRLPTFL